MNSINVYYKDTFKLVKSLIVKSNDTALQINRQLILQYGPGALGVNPNNPETWKYYLNLSGSYHKLDENIKIRLLETNKEEILTKELLNNNPQTKNELKKMGQYYDTLIEDYPDHSDLIKGMLYNIDIDKLIKAEDGDILGYSNLYIEDQENNVIPLLKEYSIGCFLRWNISDYSLVDDLFIATFMGNLYTKFILKVINIRASNVFTYNVHSFHMNEFFNSHLSITEELNVLSNNTKMWLYKNLRYLEKNVGKRNTQKIIVDKILTDNGIGASESNIVKRLHMVTDDCYKTIECDDFNKQYALILDKSVNEYYLGNNFSNLQDIDANKERDRLEAAIFNREIGKTNLDIVETKELKVQMPGNTIINPLPTIRLALDNWFHRANNNVYKSSTGVLDLNNKKFYTLNAKQAMLLTIKLITMINKQTNPVIKEYEATTVAYGALDKDKLLTNVINKRVISVLIDNINKRTENSFNIGSINSFIATLSSINKVKTDAWILSTNANDMLLASEIKNLLDKVFVNETITLTDKNETIDELLIKNNINFVYDKSSYQPLLLLEKLIRTFTGVYMKYDSCKLLTDKYINILKKLSSYTVKFTNVTNYDNKIGLKYHSVSSFAADAVIDIKDVNIRTLEKFYGKYRPHAYTLKTTMDTPIVFFNDKSIVKNIRFKTLLTTEDKMFDPEIIYAKPVEPNMVNISTDAFICKYKPGAVNTATDLNEDIDLIGTNVLNNVDHGVISPRKNNGMLHIDKEMFSSDKPLAYSDNKEDIEMYVPTNNLDTYKEGRSLSVYSIASNGTYKSGPLKHYLKDTDYDFIDEPSYTVYSIGGFDFYRPSIDIDKTTINTNLMGFNTPMDNSGVIKIRKFKSKLNVLYDNSNKVDMFESINNLTTDYETDSNNIMGYTNDISASMSFDEFNPVIYYPGASITGIASLDNNVDGLDNISTLSHLNNDDVASNGYITNKRLKTSLNDDITIDNIYDINQNAFTSSDIDIFKPCTLSFPGKKEVINVNKEYIPMQNLVKYNRLSHVMVSTDTYSQLLPTLSMVNKIDAIDYYRPNNEYIADTRYDTIGSTKSIFNNDLSSTRNELKTTVYGYDHSSVNDISIMGSRKLVGFEIYRPSMTVDKTLHVDKLEQGIMDGVKIYMSSRTNLTSNLYMYNDTISYDHGPMSSYHELLDGIDMYAPTNKYILEGDYGKLTSDKAHITNTPISQTNNLVTTMYGNDNNVETDINVLGYKIPSKPDLYSPNISVDKTLHEDKIESNIVNQIDMQITKQSKLTTNLYMDNDSMAYGSNPMITYADIMSKIDLYRPKDDHVVADELLNGDSVNNFSNVGDIGHGTNDNNIIYNNNDNNIDINVYGSTNDKTIGMMRPTFNNTWTIPHMEDIHHSVQEPNVKGVFKQVGLTTSTYQDDSNSIETYNTNVFSTDNKVPNMYAPKPKLNEYNSYDDIYHNNTDERISGYFINKNINNVLYDEVVNMSDKTYINLTASFNNTIDIYKPNYGIDFNNLPKASYSYKDNNVGDVSYIIDNLHSTIETDFTTAEQWRTVRISTVNKSNTNMFSPSADMVTVTGDNHIEQSKSDITNVDSTINNGKIKSILTEEDMVNVTGNIDDTIDLYRPDNENIQTNLPDGSYSYISDTTIYKLPTNNNFSSLLEINYKEIDSYPDITMRVSNKSDTDLYTPEVSISMITSDSTLRYSDDTYIPVDGNIDLSNIKSLLTDGTAKDTDVFNVTSNTVSNINLYRTSTPKIFAGLTGFISNFNYIDTSGKFELSYDVNVLYDDNQSNDINVVQVNESHKDLHVFDTNIEYNNDIDDIDSSSLIQTTGSYYVSNLVNILHDGNALIKPFKDITVVDNPIDLTTMTLSTLSMHKPHNENIYTGVDDLIKTYNYTKQEGTTSKNGNTNITYVNTGELTFMQVKNNIVDMYGPNTYSGTINKSYEELDEYVEDVPLTGISRKGNISEVIYNDKVFNNNDNYINASVTHNDAPELYTGDTVNEVVKKNNEHMDIVVEPYEATGDIVGPDIEVTASYAIETKASIEIYDDGNTTEYLIPDDDVVIILPPKKDDDKEDTSNKHEDVKVTPIEMTITDNDL